MMSAEDVKNTGCDLLQVPGDSREEHVNSQTAYL
jgi:hypothetical protein